MKRMKKFASLLLALVMALALAVPAMAAGDEGDGNTTIKIMVPDMSEHDFYAYQIFSGTQVEDKEDAPLADIEWGSGIHSENLLQELRTTDVFGTENPFANAATAQDVADVLSGEKADNTALAIAFAKIATDHIKGTGVKADGGPAAKGEYTIEGLAPGYYLIVDKTDLGDGTNTVRNASLLQLTRDVVITVKVDVPQVDKDVEEDRNGGSTGNAADYDIGQDVPFTFTSAVPNMTQYETYQYIFHDKMDAGLTFNNDVTVTIDGDPVPAGSYKVVTKATEGEDALTDDCTFEVRFTDLKAVVKEMGKEAGDTVVVSFTAKLNSNAVIGSLGNKNDVILEYSNNPSDYGDGETGKTPPSTVIVFTYELDTNKVDPDGAPLDDAHFRLAKVLADGSRVWATVTANREITWAAATETDNYIENAVLGENEDGSKITANLHYTGTDFFSDKGIFDIHGLDADEYELWEVQAPAGYNTPKTPFKVVIESVLDPEADPADPNATVLESLTVSLDGVFTKTNPNSEEAGNYSETGQLPVTIVNQQGTILPETGGIGTTIFYVLGGLLTLGAVVLLVTKKRMSQEEK